MDLTYYSGEMDPNNFADISSNCNGKENHHPTQEASVDDEEAPPSYADAFPPLPAAPNNTGAPSAPAVKWGKTDAKNVVKPTPKAVLTNITQVRHAFQSPLPFHLVGNICSSDLSCVSSNFYVL